MTWDEERDPRSRQLAVDLEDSLTQAEKVLMELNRMTYQLSLMRMFQRVAMHSAAGTVLAAGWGIALQLADGSRLSGAIFAVLPYLPLLVILASMGYGFGVVSLDLRRRQMYEAELMVELSRNVRELLPAIAKRNEWTELKLNSMRARLSRFPISKKSAWYE